MYHTFNRRDHVTDLEADTYLPLLWALDFNVDPMSSVVAQRTHDGQIRVLDEIVLRNATTKEACIRFCGVLLEPSGGDCGVRRRFGKQHADDRELGLPDHAGVLQVEPQAAGGVSGAERESARAGPGEPGEREVEAGVGRDPVDGAIGDARS